MNATALPLIPVDCSEADCSVCDFSSQDLFDLMCMREECPGPTYSNQPRCGGELYLNTGNE